MRSAGRPVIFLSDGLPGQHRAQIESVAPGAWILGPGDLSADPTLVERIEICYPSLPAELWPRAGSLRWLQTKQAGAEWLSTVPQALTHPAIITNVHIHAAAVSEHMWGMCLALTRNIHKACLQQKDRLWDRQPLLPGISTLAGKTACIVGLGVIGRCCAQTARALGMRVIGIRRRDLAADRAGLEAIVDELGSPTDMMAAFGRSRVIMAVLPGTPATRGIIGRKEMAVMRGAYLLNAGRGNCIDTEALVDALRVGSVRGAGLDVTDPEPLPPVHPLWTMPNVIITPHYAGDHPGYNAEAFQVFLDNLGRYMRGEPLQNVVDRQQGY